MKAILLAVLVLQLSVSKSLVGPGVEIYPINIDNNRQTREWVANGQSPNEPSTFGLVKIIVINRQGRVCMGEWFDPRPNTTEYWRCGIDESTAQMYCQSSSEDSFMYHESPLAPHIPQC